MTRRLRAHPVLAVVGTVAAINVAAWTLFVLHASSDSASPAFISAGTLAFVLGMRHAFDADHLAAIDDTTRLLVSSGRRPVGLGLGFATGHSLVVLALFVVVAAAAGSTMDAGLIGLEATGGRIAMAVAATFLLAVGAFNLASLARAWRLRRAPRAPEDGRSGPALPGGVLTMILGRRVLARVGSGWHMVPIGLLFGLGMETASEVTLLGMSAAAGSSGRLSFWALLSLPLLFAAGMSAFDTLDSLMMTHLYSSSDRESGTVRATLGLTTMALTAAIALGLGAVYAAELLRDVPWLRVLRPLAAIADHSEVLGYAIVGAYAAIWLVALAHRPRALAPGAGHSAAMAAAESSATMTP